MPGTVSTASAPLQAAAESSAAMVDFTSSPWNDRCALWPLFNAGRWPGGSRPPCVKRSARRRVEGGLVRGYGNRGRGEYAYVRCRCVEFGLGYLGQQWRDRRVAEAGGDSGRK